MKKKFPNVHQWIMLKNDAISMQRTIIQLFKKNKTTLQYGDNIQRSPITLKVKEKKSAEQSK